MSEAMKPRRLMITDTRVVPPTANTAQALVARMFELYPDIAAYTAWVRKVTSQ